MLVRLPILKLFYDPVAAFRELVETQPTVIVFSLYLSLAAVSTYCVPEISGQLEALAKVLPTIPWLTSPAHLKIFSVLFAVTYSILSALIFHLAARMNGGKASFRSFWTCYLFIAGVVTLASTCLHAVPKIHWLGTLGTMLLTIVAISTVYDFPAGRAIVTGLFAYLGQMAIVILLGLSIFLHFFRHPGHSARAAGMPALTTTHMPTDYAWAAQSLDAKPVKMDELRGKVVVLNFWATWCAPCRAEMPSLQRLYDQVKDEGIVVMSISEEPTDTVKHFLKGEHFTFPILIRYERMPLYQSTALPATFILSPDGYIVNRREGAATWDSPEMVDYLRSLKGRKYSMAQNDSGAGSGDFNLGLDPRTTALVLNNQAFKLIRRNEYAQAEEYYNRALKLLEKDPRPENADVIATLHVGQGYIAYKRGQYDEAEALYRKAIRIEEALPQPSAKSLALDYKNLADLYRAMHRLADAQQADAKSQQYQRR